MRGTLRGKVILAVGLSLLMADALGFVIARETFDRQEREEVSEGIRAATGALAERLDQRITGWQDHLASEAAGFRPEFVKEHLIAIVGSGLAGAAYVAPNGTRVTHRSHHEPDPIERAVTGPPVEVLTDAIVLRQPIGGGGTIIAWTDASFAADLFASDGPIILTTPSGLRYGTPEAIEGATRAAAEEGHWLRAGAQSATTGAEVVALAPLDGVRDRALASALGLLVTTTIVYALAGAIIFWIVSRTLAPLEQITQAAQKLGQGEHELTIEIETGDEMEILAQTLVTSARGLAQARERERGQAVALREAAVEHQRLSSALVMEQREAHHRRILEALNECVVATDTQGKVLYANAAARSHGYATGGRASAPLIEGDAPVLDAMVRSAESLAGPSVRVTTHANRLLEAQARAIGYADADAILIVLIDVTEQVRLADEAEHRRAALARSERLSALGTLVAGVAHEINNPLTYINGNIEMAMFDLGERTEMEETRRMLASALAGTERIAHITSALRAVARQGPGDAHENVDLGAVAANVHALLRVGLPDGIDLDIESAQGTFVLGSPTELHQVLLNLAKNSLEAVGEGGKVRIRVAADDTFATLAVRDDGPGIPAETLARLFTPFFTTKPHGTGLGLSIVEGIVRDHGGTIDVKTALGDGTEFIVRLPLASARAAPDAVERLQGAAPSGHQPHIQIG